MTEQAAEGPTIEKKDLHEYDSSTYGARNSTISLQDCKLPKIDSTLNIRSSGQGT